VWDEGNVYTRVCMIVMVVCLRINIAFVNDELSSRMANE
jgi:hypothetical protein